MYLYVYICIYIYIYIHIHVYSGAEGRRPSIYLFTCTLVVNLCFTGALLESYGGQVLEIQELRRLFFYFFLFFFGRCWREAAELGDAEAMCAIGLMYLEGTKVVQSYIEWRQHLFFLREHLIFLSESALFSERWHLFFFESGG